MTSIFHIKQDPICTILIFA